ncbi:MAG: DnaJ domain-containing protein [Pseudanabaenaceae cyanobacterium]
MVNPRAVFKLQRGLAQHKLEDYYAVLGLPLTAEPQEIRRKFLQLAKLLHPDVFARSPKEKVWAERYFARMVGPAYQKLNNDRERSEYFATLRYFAEDFKQKGNPPNVTSELAQKLLKLPHEITYTEFVQQLAENQYQSLDQVMEYTEQLSELNLVFLYVQKTLVQPARPIEEPTIVQATPPSESKAACHVAAAEALIAQKKWTEALAELKQAEKQDPKLSTVYALMGVVYSQQKADVMAKSNFQKALRLNPKDPIALQYTNTKSGAAPASKTAPPPKKKGLFGLF